MYESGNSREVHRGRRGALRLILPALKPSVPLYSARAAGTGPHGRVKCDRNYKGWAIEVRDCELGAGCPVSRNRRNIMTRTRAVLTVSLLAFPSAMVGRAFADNAYGDCNTFYDRCYQNSMQRSDADAQQVSNYCSLNQRRCYQEQAEQERQARDPSACSRCDGDCMITYSDWACVPTEPKPMPNLGR